MKNGENIKKSSVTDENRQDFSSNLSAERKDPSMTNNKNIDSDPTGGSGNDMSSAIDSESINKIGSSPSPQVIEDRSKLRLPAARDLDKYVRSY